MACGTDRRSRSLSGHLYALMVVPVIACAVSCTISDARPAGNKADWSSKVAAELITLYDDYSNYLASGRPGVFKSTNSLAQVIDDRVIVDAVASGDASVLKADLEALGMQHGVAFDRIVSGQLPIMAIRQLPKLPSLNFARAASMVLQRGPRLPSPGIPNY